MNTAAKVMYAFIALLILGIVIVISTAISQARSGEKDETGYFIGGFTFAAGLIGTLISRQFTSEPKETKEKYRR
jgi:hypothetical protein